MQTSSIVKQQREIDWVTDPDDYVCDLSSEIQQMAKKELREDDQMRRTALQSMRDWICQNPRIRNCRLDANFLLRFLRFKKYHVPLAQEALERLLLLRQTFNVAFHCLDIRIPMMQELTDLGFMFACPQRDSLGRRVIVARPGVFDLARFTQADMCRIIGIAYETLMEDEENQIRGFVYFVDGQGVGFAHLTLFTIKEAVRIVKNGEKTLPMRHKEVHCINVNSSIKFALDFGISLVSEKIKKRIRLYTDLSEMQQQQAVYEKDSTFSGIDSALLPLEYGGVVPMRRMIELWRRELDASHERLMSHDRMEVEETLFSAREKEGAVSALKHRNITSCGSEEGDSPLCGITGNFRKLEVD